MPKFKENKKKRNTVKKTTVEMLTAGVSVMYIAALKGLCILLIVVYIIIFYFYYQSFSLMLMGSFIFCYVTKIRYHQGCKTQVNTQLLIPKDMT